MNWSFIGLQLLAVLGLISFSIAGLYYIRHRHSRAVAGVSAEHDAIARDKGVDGGEFLKRYIPPEHRVSVEKSTRAPLFASRPLFLLTCALVPSVVLLFAASSWYLQRETFLEVIAFDAGSLDESPVVAYQFDEQLNPYAATMTSVAAAAAPERRLVVLKASDRSDHVANAWHRLLSRADFQIETCAYNALAECAIDASTTVILSLADIDPGVTDRLTRAGVNVIAYGFPEQIVRHASSVPGLHFTKDEQASGSHLAVVGDRELTLGLDAGLNLALSPLRKGVVASSERPQAVSMFADGIAGGRTDTRLFAKAHGKARLVWMDFSVADAEWLPKESQGHFDELMAAVLRYATDQSYGSIATWPEGRRYAAYFEEDTEDGYRHALRVADLFEAAKVPLTWYVLSDLASEDRATTRRLAEVGEMACHGDNHDIMPRYDLAGQRERLARCQYVVQTITGQRPSGFRPPTEAHNTDTFSAMINVGMTHVFAENSTASQVPHFKRALETDLSLVSMPRAITDDFYLWHFLKLDGKRSTARILDERNWVRSVGSLFAFSFHTQFMDNDEHFGVISELLDEVSNDEAAWIDTVGGIASWWETRDALMNGRTVSKELLARYRPTVLEVNAAGELSARAWRSALDLAAPGLDTPATQILVSEQD